MFYNGLKYEVKDNLVGRCPDDFNELKALTITLDKEHITVQDPTKKQELWPKTMIQSPDLTPTPKREPSTWQLTPDVKMETTHIRTHLSEEECAKWMKEGHCFNCGEQGHHQPECPKNKTKTQIAAVEMTANLTLTPNKPKN
jgi:hypothetical protein